ncbi:MAG: hypothetical protein ACXW3Q_14335 [Rhodoplanes sp.]
MALGREDETDGITTRASCRQLAALLKERPSVFISKVERKVREAALRLPDIPDRRHAVTGPSGAKRTAAGLTGSAAARNRKLLLVRSASLLIPEKAARKPRSSAASEDSRSSSSTPAKSRKSIAGASRSAAATSSSSGSKAARAAAPKEVAQDKRATRTLRDATAGVAAVKRNAPPVRTASLAPTGQSRPSAASADSKSASAVAAKSGKRTTSEAAMPPASKSSPAKPAPDRARAGAPEKTSRDNAPVRVAARATASPASERDRNALQGRKGSVATSKNPDRKTIASAAPAEAGKSIGAARRSTLPKLSAARSAERLRASAMEKVVKAADGRVKKVMQICRGC